MAQQAGSDPQDVPPVRARDVHRAIVRLVQELEAIDWYHAPIGVVALDARGIVLAWNGAAGEILGVREWEVLGSPFLKLFTEAAQPELDRLIALSITTDRRSAPSVFERRAADGQVQFVEVTATGLRGRTGEPGATVLLQDVTARVSAERLRREAERRFRGLVQGVDAIVWEADAATLQFAFASHRAEEILGYPVARWVMEPDFWERHIHPDDRLRAVTARREATTEGRDHTLEYRMLAADGREVWLRDKVTVLCGDDGRATRLLGLMVDITDRKRTEEALARLYRRAEDDVERKEEFLATLAHELRTPLAAITNASQVLAVDDGAAAARAREVIARQVRHLGRLTHELLDLASAASGKLTLERRSVNLGELVADGVHALADRAAALGHAVHVASGPTPIVVEADPVRLEQIVTNLVDNAIKYTPRGGRIDVTVGGDREHAVLRVRDSGCGIPPEALPRIFDPFYQAPRPPGTGPNGLGLGLTLVRRLVELHGGEITVHSEGPGRGTEFVVRLPRRAPAGATTEGDPGRAASAQRRVLVIDDDADTRDLLSEILGRAGYEPIVAEDGPQGIETCLATRPDAVVIDIALPGLEGYEVARSLRARHRPAPLLIALTGYCRPDEEVRARDAGFDALLVKPVEPERLIALLADALASRAS